MTIIRIFDVGTTGIDPKEDRVVEVAAYDMVLPARTIVDVGSHLCKIERPIPPEASAVHHITNADLEYAYLFDAVWHAHFTNPFIKLYAAHNCAFEQGFLPTPEGVHWICTYKCALRAWPNAPSHANQVLRYWRGLDRREGFDRRIASLSHRAGPDAYVSAWLLGELLDVAEVETLIRWSAEPKCFTTLTFGKHRGMKLADAPADYLGWLRDGRHEMDVDWRHAAKVELERRVAAS